MLQTRLDESVQEQGKLEDNVHEYEGKINDLEDEKVHLVRQKREMENLLESERNAMAQDNAEQKAREEELANTIQRLKMQRDSRASSDENREFPTSRESSHPIWNIRHLILLSELPKPTFSRNGERPICSSIVAPTQRLEH